MKLSISNTYLNKKDMMKLYHAPKTWVVNTNTTNWTVITEDLHPQSNNVSTETWCTISRHEYGGVISNDGPRGNVWWSMRASSFETWSKNPARKPWTSTSAAAFKISASSDISKGTQKLRIAEVPLLLTSSAHMPPAPAWLISYSGSCSIFGLFFLIICGKT